MLAVDPDLRHRRPAVGQRLHLGPLGRAEGDVDFLVGDALRLEQGLGPVAEGAECRGVEDDFGHGCALASLDAPYRAPRKTFPSTPYVAPAGVKKRGPGGARPKFGVWREGPKTEPGGREHEGEIEPWVGGGRERLRHSNSIDGEPSMTANLGQTPLG